MHLPGLARTDALADDLLALHGANWASAFELLPSSLRYVAHLHAIEAAQRERLLAHAYVRYLGDLSDGQMLRRIVAASMELPLARAAGCGVLRLRRCRQHASPDDRLARRPGRCGR